MPTMVTITRGSYRNQDIANVTLPLLKDFALGANGGYITVDGTSIGYSDKIRVKVTRNDFEMSGLAGQNFVQAPAKVETDDEIIERIGERFDILEQMTSAVIEGTVRAVIVSGAPGIGKSFIVHQEIEKVNAFDALAGGLPRATIIKGAMTAAGLYKTLFEYSNKGQVIVFDDCDGMLYDDDCLNLLKAALDSGRSRRVCWHTESRMLNEAGVPRSFDFKGAVIFISNLKFDSTGKKLGAHLEALRSRCHYLDLTMDSMRERILRIKQVACNCNLFENYRFTKTQEQEILNFMEENKNKLNEMSLRMAVKIADLVKMNPTTWKRIAAVTTLSRA